MKGNEPMKKEELIALIEDNFADGEEVNILYYDHNFDLTLGTVDGIVDCKGLKYLGMK